jgi:beta-glucosidase
MSLNDPRRVSLAVLAVLATFALAGGGADIPGYGTDVDRKVEVLLGRMTLEEKIGQMVQRSWQDTPELRRLIAEGRVGSLLNARGAEATNALQKIAVEKSRLGIPLIVGNDVIHGYKTILPIPLAQAASFDPELVEEAQAMSAREARAAGTHWTFAPMVDIARDPRWGRIAEGSGEDPYLGSALAAAKVRGFQGGSLASPESVVACPKHYVGYGAAEGGRDYNTTDMSLHTLYEVYLPPFEAAIKAGAGTIMSAFNDLNGVPASADPLTLERVLRQEWGFRGFVVSDWNSIGELIPHGIAADLGEASVAALSAGVDMDMEGNAYASRLKALVEAGRVSEKAVDESARRILRIKFLLGLFDRPYVDTSLEAKVTLNAEDRAIARKLAQESVVLLKNEGGLLPLEKTIGTLAVIGPLADDRFAPLGTWACEGKADTVVSVLAGIKAAASPGTRLLYEPGCEALGEAKDEARTRASIERAVSAAQGADAVVAVVGEPAGWSGEAASRATLDLPGHQERLLRALKETGKPMVVVILSGRPLALPWVSENATAVLQAWHLGVESGNAIADLLFGDAVPTGKLPVTVPRLVGQVPIYYDHLNTGRPENPKDKFTSKYIDAPSAPLYPFGFGLSTTTFAYSNLKVDRAAIGPAGRLTVSVDVKNTGQRAGVETVQIYIHDLVASMSRPVRELKGFRRVALEPGQVETVSFILGPGHLGFYDRNLEYVVEPGRFQVWAGPNSAEGPTATFEVR